MDDYNVRFDSEFLTAYMQMLSEESDGYCSEFCELMKLSTDFSKLMDEYSRNSIELFRRLKKEHKMSDNLFKLLSNREITPEEIIATDNETKKEFMEFRKMNLRGEIVRTELYGTYEKAIKLRRKVLKANMDLIPNISSKYDLPQEMQIVLNMIIKSMLNQLEIMILQAAS